ncbi:MAG: class sortase [Ornithinibacter sp.]|jgi:sortase (surface protein transpeptidase)|nr:class sortase [Ornithinibacter sp.]
MRRGPLLAVGLALTVLAVALLTWVLQRGGESAEALPGTGTSSPSASASTAGDVRIRIPAIGLDHETSGGGLTPEGTIDPDPGILMWFQGLDRVPPGRVGTAVIAGHVATGDRPDVLAELAEVEVGDDVQVVEDGRTIPYRVTRAGPIDKVEVTTDEAVWGVNTSRSRLAIITCDDAFGFRGDGHRRANFVVIAEPA